MKNGEVRRRTMVCEHFGHFEATKSKDPKKETTTKRVGCIWQINLSCPEKDNPNKLVYVAKLINEHKNHNLDQARYNFQENIIFITEITEDVKFFETKMNCSPQQIHKALEEKYFVKVYMPVLQQVIQRFRPRLRDQTNDASQLYKELLSKKEVDPRWYVEVDWDHNSKYLC